MPRRPTYAEIANDWSLWRQFVDRHATRAHFESLALAARIAVLVKGYGPELAGHCAYVTDGTGRFLLQVPARNAVGFSLTDGWKFWPGGLGSGMTAWWVVAPDQVPQTVRATLDAVAVDHANAGPPGRA